MKKSKLTLSNDEFTKLFFTPLPTGVLGYHFFMGFRHEGTSDIMNFLRSYLYGMTHIKQMPDVLIICSPGATPPSAYRHLHPVISIKKERLIVLTLLDETLSTLPFEERMDFLATQCLKTNACHTAFIQYPDSKSVEILKKIYERIKGRTVFPNAATRDMLATIMGAGIPIKLTATFKRESPSYDEITMAISGYSPKQLNRMVNQKYTTSDLLRAVYNLAVSKDDWEFKRLVYRILEHHNCPDDVLQSALNIPDFYRFVANNLENITIL